MQTQTTLSNKITKYHWILFAICFFGTAFSGLISTLMSVYLPVAVKELLGNKNAEELNIISAYINAFFIFGGAFGGFTFGIVSDRYGRKISVIAAIACYALFAIFTSYVPSWKGVVFCRFFSGFGLGGVLVTTTTIMMEEWPKKTRAIFLGILSISIPVGIFSAGAIDFFVSSWRRGFMVGFIPLGIAVLGIWLLKESTNWLDNKQQIIEGAKHKENILSAQHRPNLLLGSLIFGTMLIGLWAIFSWIPTWIQSLVLVGDAQKERGLSMMMLGMGGLTGGFLSGWLTNAIGLKRSMILCFAVCSILSFILFKTNGIFSPVIYLEIAILALAFGASQGVLSVYIPNLFPVNIRATATGFCFNIGRLFTATAVLFIGVLVTKLGGYGSALFIFSSVFIIGLVVTFFSPSSAEIGQDQILSAEEIIPFTLTEKL